MFLRVPSAVWTVVSEGQVSEFRASTGNAPQLWQTRLPTLAVAYRRRLSRTEYDYRLMMLEGIRREALGAITDAGLRAAGYDSEDAFARFRRDWCLAEHRRFEPLRQVFVFTVRPIARGDLQRAGMTLVGQLYGDYVENAVSRVQTVQTEPGAGPTTRHPRKPTRRRPVFR